MDTILFKSVRTIFCFLSQWLPSQLEEWHTNSCNIMFWKSPRIPIEAERKSNHRFIYRNSTELPSQLEEWHTISCEKKFWKSTRIPIEADRKSNHRFIYRHATKSKLNIDNIQPRKQNSHANCPRRIQDTKVVIELPGFTRKANLVEVNR